MKTKEKTFFRVVKDFFEPAFYYKKISIIALIPAIISSVIILLSINLIKDITNKLSDWLVNEIKPLILYFVFLVILHYVIMTLFRNSTHATIFPKFRKHMYRKYIDGFLHLDNNEAEKQWTWKLIAMIDWGMQAWSYLLVHFFIDVIPSMITVLFSITFIWIINIYYSVVVFFVSVLIFLLTALVQKKAKKYRVLRREANISITKKLVKILMSKFEVLQNNKQCDETKKITDSLNYNISLNHSIGNLEIFVRLLVRILVDGSKLFIIVLFGFGLYNNTIDFWEFMALMSVAYVLEQILSSFLVNYIDFSKRFVEVERLWNFFEEKPFMDLQDDKPDFIYKKWTIKLKGLTYWYNKREKVFDDFSLKIPGEKVTAMVWASWGGKSTLVKLISAYIKPDAWEVIVDWQKLSEVALKSYYKEVWYLTQEPSVFDWTILENLTYAVSTSSQPSPSVLCSTTKDELEEKGQEQVSSAVWNEEQTVAPFPWKGERIKERGLTIDDKIKEVIKLAKCEFIYNLSEWINTQIGERGVRLSWGQKQRLAIAKIFLKNPKIIILDEPTSALDSFSEELITKAMHNLFKWRTVIIIAHRLQTVKHADKIFVIEWGKVVEEWNHKELVKKKGIYKRMLDLQSGF